MHPVNRGNWLTREFSLATGEFYSRSYTVNVVGDQLTVGLEDLGEAQPGVIWNALTITPVEGTELLLQATLLLLQATLMDLSLYIGRFS